MIPVQNVHVDRIPEHDVFTIFLSNRRDIHILFVEGKLGMGKTHLLIEFENRAVEHSVDIARINLDDTSLSIEHVLYELTSCLDNYAFHGFETSWQTFIESNKVPIADNTLTSSVMNVTVGRLSPDATRRWRMTLTKSFFNSLVGEHSRPNRGPVIILFDNFHAANIEVREWLERDFLKWVNKHHWLKIVIAGESLPRIDLREYRLCQHMGLHPLTPRFVQELATKVGIHLTETEMRFLYSVTRGKPFLVALTLMELQEGGSVGSEMS